VPENKALPLEVLVTSSAEETQAVGRALGERLPIPGVVLLRGPLGAGKTTLTRGIAEGLGVSDPEVVTSPSFTLINIYEGRCPIYHVDLYRLEGERDLYSIGMDDFIGTRGVTIVEWSERLESPPLPAVVVEIALTGADDRREIVIRPLQPVLWRKARSGAGAHRGRQRK
jgi:tRNA threonylcarbamoyladenosine biosynthesis protein TsaE